jgi:hypothetical protein
LYFKNTENLNAKIRSLAEGLNRESSLKELKNFLKVIFSPTLKDCYQEVLPLAPIDEIEVKPDKISLIIYEPYQNGGLHPDLLSFYNDLQFKNRVLFLSGLRGNIERILDKSAELKAIQRILEEMNAEKVADNDPQKMSANELKEKYTFQLLTAIK